MFRGSTIATIDDKGRLKVPTDFRRHLEERYGGEFFVTSVRGDRAIVYPLPVWEEIEARLAALPATDPTRQRFLERVSYFGAQVALDSQGRLLLPPIVRELMRGGRPKEETAPEGEAPPEPSPVAPPAQLRRK